jgi:Ca2+/Na+ antiporter
MSQSIDHHQLIKTLGRAGLIPFVLLALMVWLLVDNDLQPFVATALACYAAIIASFLGGVHWGAAWVHSEAGSSHRDEHQVPALWWGISAPLLAWLGILIPILSGLVWYIAQGELSIDEVKLQAQAGLVWLGLLLIACYLIDRKLYPAMGAAGWLTLRFRLTVVASLSCFLAAAQI